MRRLILTALLLAACNGESTDPGADAGAALPEGDVTVKPSRVDSVLVNPGIGFASFHFGWWCDLPPITYTAAECAKRVAKNWPENYPKAGTAYFRWHWRDLEPTRGKIRFDLIDRTLQSANAAGMTLGFRVMTIKEGKVGVPDWLLKAPYSVKGSYLPGTSGSTHWPDYRDKTYQREHARLLTALGKRYDGHPALDHVDIGTVGCWGEWNTACLKTSSSLVEVYKPSDDAERKKIVAAYKTVIDHHLKAFIKTPRLMLGVGDSPGAEVEIMAHAVRGGAGWRVDCWGDWGLYGGKWNHHEHSYPQMIANLTKAEASFPNVWKKAPVHLEVCFTMPKWHAKGYKTAGPDGEVYKSFQWALGQHASLLNGKSSKIPADYVPAVQGLQKKTGYRLVVDRFNHHGQVSAGQRTLFSSTWTNLGVAPAYAPRTLTYRLRGAARSVKLASTVDIRAWLPGAHKVKDTVVIPADLPAGEYALELALLDRDGINPATSALPPLRLGIKGRGADGWYGLSKITVR